MIKKLIVAATLIAALCTMADAVEFKLGEFNISMTTPAPIDHISYGSDTYDDHEVNTASFKIPLFLSYEVTVLKSLSKSAEEFKGTPIADYSDIEMDGKPARMILANQFTTIEYVKDDKTLITLQFKESVGTDFSDSIAESIKSFKATRA